MNEQPRQRSAPISRRAGLIPPLDPDHLHDLVEDSIFGVYLIQAGRFRYVNQTLAELFGYTPEEITSSKSVADLVAPEDRQLVAENLRKRLEGEERRIRYAFRGVRRDGSLFHVEVLGTATQYGGEPAVIGALIDISEQAQAREELREANQHLEALLAELRQTHLDRVAQERLNVIGQLASGIGHNFKNALQPTLGYSELLLRNEACMADPTVRQYVELIHKGALNALETAERMREIYQPSDPPVWTDAVYIHDIAQRAVELAEPRLARLGDKLTLDMDLQPVPSLPGIAVELRDAVLNLILNAADAMPEGGVLTIRTQHADPCAMIEVRDSGIGMSEEVRQRALEPFFTTKGERGSGLGLATVAGTMRRHNGIVDIQSQQGAGTTITLKIPTRPLAS